MAVCEKKVALVTGASRGLGRAMAVAFAKAGHDVAINFVSNAAEAKKTAALVESAGAKALLLQADVRSSADVNAMVKRLELEWGRLDVLVNNAGGVRNNLISKTTDDEWRDVMALNLDGAFFCTRAAIPLMRAQRSGSVVNITSYLAYRAIQGGGNYAVAKAGLVMLTKSAALEEGRHNIRVNAVLPGFHVTDMNRDVWARFEKNIREQHLLSELPSEGGMADFIVTIASLPTVTGQVFPFESRLM